MNAAAEVSLVFDTDGTLLDGRQVVIDAVAEGLESTYRHFDLPLPDIDRERIALAIGLPANNFFRVAFAPESVPIPLHDAFACEFEVRSTRAEVAALWRGESQLYDGVEETLAALAERGHAMALFSNATAPYFEAVVAVHRLDRFFSRKLSLENAVRTRIARDKTGIVRHLTDGYRTRVVIGDRIHDIDAGRSAGARTVGCLYGFGRPDELATADWTIDRMSELLELPLVESQAR
jgi:phosphoglycolate phosphatase